MAGTRSFTFAVVVSVVLLGDIAYSLQLRSERSLLQRRSFSRRGNKQNKFIDSVNKVCNDAQSDDWFRKHLGHIDLKMVKEFVGGKDINTEQDFIDALHDNRISQPCKLPADYRKNPPGACSWNALTTNLYCSDGDVCLGNFNKNGCLRMTTGNIYYHSPDWEPPKASPFNSGFMPLDMVANGYYNIAVEKVTGWGLVLSIFDVFGGAAMLADPALNSASILDGLLDTAFYTSRAVGPAAEMAGSAEEMGKIASLRAEVVKEATHLSEDAQKGFKSVVENHLKDAHGAADVKDGIWKINDAPESVKKSFAQLDRMHQPDFQELDIEGLAHDGQVFNTRSKTFSALSDSELNELGMNSRHSFSASDVYFWDMTNDEGAAKVFSGTNPPIMVVKGDGVYKGLTLSEAEQALARSSSADSWRQTVIEFGDELSSASSSASSADTQMERSVSMTKFTKMQGYDDFKSEFSNAMWRSGTEYATIESTETAASSSAKGTRVAKVDNGVLQDRLGIGVPESQPSKTGVTAPNEVLAQGLSERVDKTAPFLSEYLKVEAPEALKSYVQNKFEQGQVVGSFLKEHGTSAIKGIAEHGGEFLRGVGEDVGTEAIATPIAGFVTKGIASLGAKVLGGFALGR